MSSTNRGAERRADDAYYTPAWCVRALLRTIGALPSGRWLEPAAGNGAIARAVNEFAPDPNRHWRLCDIRPEVAEAWADLHAARRDVGQDFTEARICDANRGYVDVIITNPPFSDAQEFVEKSLHLGRVVIMLLRLNWLASKSRNDQLLKHPPSVYVLPKRPCFTDDGNTDSCDYAWFVWGATEQPECHVIAWEDCE